MLSKNMPVDIMEHLFKDFKKFPLEMNEISDKLKAKLQTFYKDITEISKETPRFTHEEAQNVKDNTSLLGSNFVPSIISSEIKKCKRFFIFKTKINNKFNVTVKFLVNNNDEINDYFNIFKKIYIWLKFIYKYSDTKQTKFTLYIYLSDYKKKLPDTKTELLSQVNCNTAVTYACAINGECLIYRKEEWFKVLIHETMHSLCLDFSGLDYPKLKSKVKELFPIKSEFEISESYSEFWATFLNSAFESFFVSETEASFIKNWEIMMYFENIFTFFQVIKILDFLEIIDYENLLIKSTYKEKTHVFEYYIIKMIFLFNYDSFFQLCDKHNSKTICFTKTDIMLDKIFSFIKEKHKSQELLENLNWMKIYYARFSDNKETIGNTMRMTLFS